MKTRTIWSIILLCGFACSPLQNLSAKKKKSKKEKTTQKKKKKQSTVQNPALVMAQQMVQASAQKPKEKKETALDKVANSNPLLQQAQSLLQQFSKKQKEEAIEQEKEEKNKNNPSYKQAQQLLANLLSKGFTDQEELTRSTEPSIMQTIYNPDKSFIWGVGEDNYLFQYVDDEWKRIYSTGVTKFLGIAYHRSGTLYGLNTRNKVYSSSDNGKSWVAFTPDQTQKFDQLLIRHGHRFLLRELGESKIYTLKNNDWSLLKEYDREISLY